MKTKGRIIKAAVIATLLYGSEARFFRKKNVAAYQDFVDRDLQSIGVFDNKNDDTQNGGKSDDAGSQEYGGLPDD